MTDDVPLEKTIPSGAPPYPWQDRDAKIQARMIAVSEKLQTTTHAVDKKNVLIVVLAAMRQLAKVKLTGHDKKAIVVDLVARLAIVGFKAAFANGDQLDAYAGQLVEQAWTALGQKVFGKARRCC